MTIDSVEKYQGSERRVIIISTVRTKFLAFVKDKQVGVGFGVTVGRGYTCITIL
jgi:hypothetical protein